MTIDDVISSSAVLVTLSDVYIRLNDTVENPQFSA